MISKITRHQQIATIHTHSDTHPQAYKLIHHPLAHIHIQVTSTDVDHVEEKRRKRLNKKNTFKSV